MKRLLLLMISLVLVACSRAEPEIPLPHEMPPLPTAVPRQVLPLSFALLSPTELDGDWRAAPCPDRRPFFCLYDQEDESVVASLSLTVTPLSNSPILRDLMTAEGLELGHTPRYEDAAYRQLSRAILAELAQRDLDNVTAEMVEGREVLSLERQPVEIGPLPGLSFGHMVLEGNGAIVEYVRFYAVFDGDVLYWLTLFPGETAVFPAESTALAKMVLLEEAAVALLAQLQLPVTVVDSEVERVRAELRVTLTAVHGEGFVQNLHGGELLTVLGISEDGNWWRVACPEESRATSCWLPNDTGRVRPR